eukprot:COSAG02_NODE_1705_length_11236_cov_6.168178_11_plen_108_part_00
MHLSMGVPALAIVRRLPTLNIVRTNRVVCRYKATLGADPQIAAWRAAAVAFKRLRVLERAGARARRRRRARGPARSSQPGHIEFGTGKMVGLEMFRRGSYYYLPVDV